ncbi:MAG: CopD family protein [Ferruginibacter sp.]|nr:CopD family protein [Cytophagales bacterium]
MTHLYLKALHIIFVVSWFAGLLYIPRLFIYFTEANERPESERRVLQTQFAKMQRLLWYGITWPAALLTLVLGLSAWHTYGSTPDWLVYKLVLVFLLYLYHLSCHVIFRQQQKGIVRYTSQQLRVWNEVATVFLVGIVFLVVLKDAMSMLWGLLGLVVFVAVLLLAIRTYRIVRQRQSQATPENVEMNNREKGVSK